jgi:N-acetylglucosaminyl-diphospho-decaprenol L-rhamnosyltransferase
MHGSVIIVTWNASEVIDRCLDSVQQQILDGGFETIVVDNASTDGTPELLRRREPVVRVILNPHNAGFAGANNQAAREARGQVLFFLNPDTELVGTDVLERLGRTVEDPSIGVGGPLLLNPDGTVQPSCAGHPSVAGALAVGSGLHRLLPDELLRRIAPQFWSHDRSIDTDWLMGAALALRADVFRELGGFWPNMYGEDEDLAYRATQRGLRVRFDPAAKVMHVGNHAAAQRWSSADRAARVASSELAFLRAHYTRPRVAAIRAITAAGYGTRAVVHRILGRDQPAGVYRAMARVYLRRSAPPPEGSEALAG